MADFKPSKHDEWDGETERRALARATLPPPPPPPPPPGAPVTQEELVEALRLHRHNDREFICVKFAELEELIRDGFPDGDPASHRKVHEGYIKDAANRSEMWRAVWKQVLTGTVWATMVFLAGAILLAVKTELKK